MPKKLIQKSGKGLVEKSKKAAGDIQNESEELVNIEGEEGFFTSEPAIVTVKRGVTINMTNFEFLRIDVELSMPCTVDDVDDAYEKTLTWVKERLDKEMSNV